MKAVRFLSRFALICNLCFLLFIFFRWLEQPKASGNIQDSIEQVPFVKELVILLGFTAIVVNIVMCIVYSICLFTSKFKQISTWLVIINFLFLFLQIFYFFFY